MGNYFNNAHILCIRCIVDNTRYIHNYVDVELQIYYSDRAWQYVGIIECSVRVKSGLLCVK